MDRRTFVKATLAAASATALGLCPSSLARRPASRDDRVLRQERHEPVLESVPHRRREGGQGARRQRSRRVAPTKPDNIEEQTRLVEDWIVKKPDAFVFVPVDYKALVPIDPEGEQGRHPGRRLQQPHDRRRARHLCRLGRRDDGVRDLQVPVQVDGRQGQGRPHRRRAGGNHRAEAQEGLRARGEGDSRVSRCSPRSPATTAGCRRCRCSRT